MISPAKASFQRKLAAQASPIPGPEPRRDAIWRDGFPEPAPARPMPESGPVASEYQQLLAALQLDMNRLRQIQSTERKIEAKRTMIGQYLPWVEGALAADPPAQDEIAGNMLIWALDIADWDLAYRLAAHVLKHGLALPERYRRTPATLIAEEVAEAGLAPRAANAPAPISREWLQRFAALVEGHDIFDQVRAKLAKAIGLALHAEAEAFDPAAPSALAGGRAGLLAQARASFAQALALDRGAGVKKLIEAIDRELKKAPQPASEPEP